MPGEPWPAREAERRPAPLGARVAARSCARAPHGTFAWCPNCDGRLLPEHAHYRCCECGWRDGCCD